ncbi:AmpG family muropeptide MFS transporter [Pseudoalteromonas xiamenensis]|uniref:MFS transporter n=1 Tax=Pseudoalteromonas xiamenensis TaxID=882626 RepID=A0A975DID1_9GAMM|nr:MFS transporter [Pseudoalteromonas xiamenensis]QTH70851.1 MFS transporter [Pseudoalteromonas xiamenensis]
MTPSLMLNYFKMLFSDKRLATVFGFGIASGFPWVLIGSVMSAWLKDEGLSRSTIGLFGLVFGAYTVNFLWSPLLDRIKLPYLHAALGQRRSWILVCQLIAVCATLKMATLDIQNELFLAALCCFIIALSCATQDIAIDGFRIDCFEEHEGEKITAAAAMATSGWWTGYALLGAIPFFLADLPSIEWPQVYFVLAGIFVVLIVITLFANEPKTHREQTQADLEARYQARIGSTSGLASKVGAWLAVTVIEPFASFFKRNGFKTALSLILFIFLFKIGESFLARMSIVFYKEIGFSNSQIAQYSKLGSGLITIIFALLGSLFNQRYGIVKGLFISGIAMAASNLMFSWIAISGPKEYLYLAAIIIDGFTQAWSLVALVAFISMLCDRAFSATHYALLASIGSLGRTVLSSYSGVVIDDWLHGNWALFFVITALMVLPSLLFLYLIRDKLYAVEAKSKAASALS